MANPRNLIPYLFPALVLTVLSTLQPGCSTRVSSRQLVSPSLEIPADTISATDALADATPVSRHLLVDSLVQEALSLCDAGVFAVAHTLLRQAVELIEAGNGSALDKTGQRDMLFHEIVETYIDKFPYKYLDSIPENIAGLVLRYQLIQSMNTFPAPEDSTRERVFHDCQEGIPYNIPIVQNRYVYAALHLICVQRKKSTERLLGHAAYYLDFMQKLLLSNSMPTDLAYLPLLESRFNPRAYSYAHAAGIWQFIPSTGKTYGLRRDYWVDERRDPIRSTEAAIQYLRKLYDDFNDWHLALAAYNCGENCVGRAVSRADTADFWQLNLPRQTLNYVPLFIAYQMVAKNPQCFGLTVEPKEPFDLDTVQVSVCLDLNKVADGINVKYGILKEINPHLRHWATPPDMENVVLYLPAGSADTFRAYYETLTDEDKVKWYRYRIDRGDNLISIARKFKLSVPAIKSVNKIPGTRIVAGRHLFIPIPLGGSYRAEQADSKGPAGTSSRTAKRAWSMSEEGTLEEQGLAHMQYRVSAGQTLSEIADLFQIRVSAICKWNRIAHARSVKAGRVLTLYVPKDLATGEISQEPAPAPRIGPKQVYVVRRGENLYAIAHKLSVNVNHLASWNSKDMDAPLLHPGDTLTYYTPPKPETDLNIAAGDESIHCFIYEVKDGDNLSTLASLFAVDLNALLKLNSLSRSSAIKVGDLIKIPKSIGAASDATKVEQRIVYYRVIQGDNLWSIARLFKIPVAHLLKANNLTRDSIIVPGDTVVVVLREGS